MKRFLLFFTLIFISISSYAQDISGTWKGTINSLGNELDLYYIIALDNEGKYTASLDVPTQAIKGMKIDSVLFDGKELILKINLLNATYRGVYVMNSFLGTYQQNSTSIPCSLNIAELPKPPKRVQEPLPPYPYKEENVSFINTVENIRLGGTLTIPEGKGPFTAIVLVNGSGQQNRDSEIFNHKPFKVLADYLTRNGIAVLRYDDRGVGESEGDPKGATSANFANDAQAALNYLASRSDISKVGFAGHSEGGIISFMVAARDTKVAFVVSLGGPAVRGSEIILTQQQAILKASGYTQQMLDAVAYQNTILYNVINESQSNDETLRTTLSDTLKVITNNMISQKDIDKVLETYLDNWMYHFLRYSPYEDIKSVQIPILALNGSKDLQVSASQNIPKYIQICTESGNNKLTTHILPDLNHLFQECSTGNPNEYQQIEQTFSEEAMKIIVEWIHNIK